MATKRQIKKQDAMKAKTAAVAIAEPQEVTEVKVAEAKEVKKATKKTATKKEMKTTLIVEHQGKQVGEKEMIASVKKAWTKTGKRIGDIKSMTLYVKPEEDAVYYVINDTETGKVEF